MADEREQAMIDVANPIDQGAGREAVTGDKLIFANQLRGLCVISVVLVHYTTVVQYMRKDVAWVIAAPPLNSPLSPIGLWFYPPWLDLGKFGVSTFFLISGFVIPFSLRRSGAIDFLLARAVRVYPTFWLALMIEAVTIAASGHYWHRPPAFGIGAYLINGLLIQTPLNRAISVDWVSWTLSIEVKFYLLAALLRPYLLARRVWPLIGLAVVSTLINVSQGEGMLHLPDQLVSEFMYLGYIFIGTLFHYHYERALSSRQLLGGVLVLAALFFASYSIGPTAGGARSLQTGSYAIAILVFTACYVRRTRFSANRVLDAAAAISYPLYLVHAAFGFTVISFLIMGRGVPYAISAIVAAMLSVVVAIGLHVFVESPSIRLGHRIRGRLRNQSRPALSEAGQQ